MDLNDELSKKSKELEALRAVLASYPDAKAKEGRNRTQYYTADVPLDHPDLCCQFGRSCGCCIDAAYQMSLYVTVSGIQVHATGWYRKFISSANEWHGRPEDLEEDVRASLSSLPAHLVDRAMSYLNAQSVE